MTELPLADREATLALGRRLGAVARAGDVVLLDGPLGAGKTVLVRGLAQGLGSTAEVASPTFVLVRQYGGRLNLVHADLYRLDDPRDVDRLGLLEMTDDAVLVVEWPERAPALAAAAALRLHLGSGPTVTSRTATISSAAPHLEAALDGGADPR